MKLKEIEKIQPERIRKKGKVIKLVEGPENLLLLDIYHDKAYYGRYVQDINTGEYREYRNGTWVTRRLEAFLMETKYEYCFTPNLKDWKWNSEKDEKDAGEKLGAKYGVFEEISNMEYHYNSEKRANAYDRKVQRIERLMGMVPDLPEDFPEWWLNTCDAVKEEEYMFWDKKKNRYGCTACGKEHEIKKCRHRQDYTCTRTGKRTTIIKRQQEITVRDYAIVLSSVDADRAVERLVEVEVCYSYCKKHIFPEDMIRVILSRDGKNPKIYYDQEFRDYCHVGWNRRDIQWWDTNGASKRWHNAYLYPPDRDVLKGTDYEDMHLPEMAAVGGKLNYSGLMVNHEKAGMFEYILKMGLRRLAEEVSGSGCWEDNYEPLNWKGNSAEEILGIDMQRIRRLRQKNGGTNMLKWLMEEQRTGKKIRDETLKKLEEYWIHPDDYSFILDRMSPEQLVNYIERNKDEWKKDRYYFRSDWKDYLAMAQRLGMDVYDPIVFRPKNLKKRHDALVDEIQRLGDDLWICEIAAKYPDIDSICQKIKDKYEYGNERYVMMVPDGIRDIVDDGKQLHHCSASSERYFDRINRQECYILFLRKKEAPEKAWYTVEIQPGGTIRQKRTAFNRQDEVEAVTEFLREWQKAVKKRLTREDAVLEQQSSIQREIEQMELLQKGDEKSMRVWQELENDFLENGNDSGEIMENGNDSEKILAAG